MLARFERLVEQAVEGSLHRIFPTTLQPVQLAKAAARAMEEGRVVGLRGAEVPNSYLVHIAPADHQRLGGYAEKLSQELSEYLLEYARDRGMRPIGEPRVTLVSDPRIRPSSVRAEAHFTELPADRRAEVEAAMGSTRRLRLAELAAASVEPASETARADTWWLVAGADLRYALQPEAGLIRVGRAADNDVVISQQRVSRYHAQLRRVESTWLVYDLESTNGTFVDQVPVEPTRPRRLLATSTVRLGDFDLRVTTAPRDAS